MQAAAAVVDTGDAQLPPEWPDPVRTLLLGTGLVIREGDNLTFIHRSFAEYLASARIAAEVGPAREDIYPYVDDVIYPSGTSNLARFVTYSPNDPCDGRSVTCSDHGGPGPVPRPWPSGTWPSRGPSSPFTLLLQYRTCEEVAMRFKALRVAVTAMVVLSLAAPAQASPQQEQPVSLVGKKILVVNDDSVQAARPNGTDGLGLYVLRQALCRAGADVAVVAPWAPQGGKSRSTAGVGFMSAAAPLAMPAGFSADCASAPARGLVLGVCQGSVPCGPDSLSVTPADAVDLALGGALAQRLGWNDGPDLVVSGINAGPNTDLAINLSGTVGAATAAVERGVAAVAVSAGTRVTPPPTAETYAAAAAVVIRLLTSPRAWSLLRDMVLVNVNQPDVQPGSEPSPVRWTSVGRVAQGRVSYTGTGNGAYQLSYNPVMPPPRLEPDSDTKALLDGYVSVSAVAVHRGYTGR